MESIRSIAIDQTGRIIAAGEAEQQFALACYLDDGQLDPAFGEGGKVLTDFDYAGYEGIWALVIDAEGRLVVGGSAE
ncbi:MAG: hypothetical protein HC802_02405 [Caldilineaceae bacterium]|nr:hypothetical protein [Caldilineaceae bacterium]